MNRLPVISLAKVGLFGISRELPFGVCNHGESCASSQAASQENTLFFFFKILFLFIYFWLRWAFLAARRLSLVAASRGYSSLRCAGFSLRRLLLLWSMGSRRTGFSSCGSQALERRLSSCGAWAQLLYGMWDLPEPGIEPVSPALAGKFLTTAPPGKSRRTLLQRKKGSQEGCSKQIVYGFSLADSLPGKKRRLFSSCWALLLWQGMRIPCSGLPTLYN